MKRVSLLILSVVLSSIILVGYMGVATQEAVADNGPYGKYLLSTDSTQYIELKPSGSCLIGAREYTPSGQTGKLESLSGTYEVKGDMVILELKTARGTLKSEFRLEGNNLVPQRRPVPRGLEGAKYIKK